MLILFVLSCKTWNVAKPGAWMARSPAQGLNNLKISPHFICGVASLALTAGSHSQSHSSPGRLEARSEFCSALSLKPKQDYLISLTPSSPVAQTVKCLPTMRGDRV